MKKTYIGQCEHLNNCCIIDDDCLKRYFHIKNPKTNEIEILIFCNDWLKLEIQKEKLNSDCEYKFYGNKDAIKVLEREFLKHLKLSNHYFNSPFESKDISKFSVGFTICDRPFTHANILLIDIINIYKENPCYRTQEMFIEGMSKFFSNIQYKKYKTLYKELIYDLKRIKKNYYPKEEYKILVDELITKTFLYITKNN